MSTQAHALRDSMTMLRRNLKHAQRYPALTFSTLLIPVLLLLLFVGVFGRTLGAGIGGGHYIDYIAPGIFLLAATGGSVGTAIGVSMDMTEGIINRFRTMAISPASVLTGHVLGSVIQTLLSIVLVVGAAALMGFRPDASVVEWLAAFGLLALLTLALTWVSAGIGLVARSPETASNIPTPFLFLPMLGSGFVPPESMPAGVRWFAEHQPFTPMIETLRGLLLGTAIGTDGLVALAWCAVLTAVGYVWAKRSFRREPKPAR